MTSARAEVTSAELEQHRRELTGYCYRMLGSVHEAEDAVQDTFVRAWRAADRFEDRTDSGDGLRRWLYRIASNVCMDMLKGRTRRAMPMALVPAADGPQRPVLGDPMPAGTWVEPAPDDLVLALAGDPAEQAVARESVRLAFVAALQLLAPRQRAILLLRDVLRWKATEVADLLDTTVHAVNSGLRRARVAVATAAAPPPAGAAVDHQLLARYIDAFERLDMLALVALLHEDVTLDMPPYELWLRGVDAVRAWLVDSDACLHARFVPLSANGCPAVAIYDSADEPFAIQVFDVADRRIAAIHTFLDPALFPRFGL